MNNKIKYNAPKKPAENGEPEVGCFYRDHSELGGNAIYLACKTSLVDEEITLYELADGYPYASGRGFADESQDFTKLLPEEVITITVKA